MTAGIRLQRLRSLKSTTPEGKLQSALQESRAVREAIKKSLAVV